MKYIKHIILTVLAMVVMIGAWAQTAPEKQPDGSWKFTMPAANKLVKVEYGLVLTLESNNTAMGTVAASTGSSVIDNGNGTYTVDTNTTVTVTATANTGYHLENWNDGDTNNPRMIIVTKDTALTATFAIDVFEVFVKQTDHGTVMYNGATGSNHYWISYNTEISLTAIADENYHFVKWNDDNSTENPRTVAIIRDSTFSATFAINTSRLDSVRTTWAVYADNATVPICPYSTNDTMGYVMIPKGAKVVITPQPVAQAVKVDKLEVINKPVTLASIDSNYTAKDGDILTGTLPAKDVEISIADGATVILDGLTVGTVSFARTGLNCLGDATIILKENTVNNLAGSNQKAGIYVPAGHTLTICGTGTLNATGGMWGAAGIGAGSSNSEPGGHIIITGGTITATGGENAAGIGGGSNGDNGDITITGGTITATGGENAAGIGGGHSRHNGTITITGGTVTAWGGENAPAIGAGLAGRGGNITITNTVTDVTAHKGGGQNQSSCDCIGKSSSGGSSCGTVTIGGTIYYNGAQYQNSGHDYLRQDPIIYHPQH
jgi:hypothetical protein